MLLLLFPLLSLLVSFVSFVACDLTSLLKNDEVFGFGDSLTYGLFVPEEAEPSGTAWFEHQHPYSLQLSSLMQQNHANLNVTVKNDGVNGEQTQHMVTRLRSILEAHPNHAPAITIILGGTNDLGHHHRNESTIISNILHLHRLVLSKAVQKQKPTFTVAMTIPDGSFIGMGPSKMKWTIINNHIRDFAHRCSERVMLLDLATEFKLTEGKESKGKSVWSSDHVHFSALGYDRIGTLLYELIRSYPIPKQLGNHQQFLRCVHEK